ncbi:MAG TPA: VOC family protein [Acetobacteraceae bacterium]|nr:VOC family protein [Acetobacteraceae bacterium]
MGARQNPVRAFHHVAYRCRDSEETRRFYEDFLGLELAEAFEIGRTATGRSASVLHSFYRLGDGTFLAFFEAPESRFDFKTQHDFDLHVAMEVSPEVLEAMLAKGRAAGIETRGPSDHGIMRSIYFRDPNGYVVELAAKTPSHDTAMDPATNGARAKLDAWQAKKAQAA